MGSERSQGIHLDGLAKSFNDKQVLRSVSLNIPAGQSTGLIGPSASGKSVLLKCLVGLMQVDTGNMRYGDRELTPILTNTILSLIERETSGKGTTVLAVTGDMKAARSRFDNIAMLFDGEIKWSGKRDAVPDAGNPYLEQMINGQATGPIRMRLAARE